MSTTLDTKPDILPQAPAEDIVWGVDVAAQLTGVQTVTLPVAALYDDDGATVALPDAVTVDGTVIRQRVRAGTLTPGLYRLVVRFTPSASTNVLQSTLRISCR